MIPLELDRKKARAEKLHDWLNNPANRMRSTYEVIAKDYRKLIIEIENEESIASITGKSPQEIEETFIINI